MNLALKIYLIFNPRKQMSHEELKNLHPNNILLFSNTALGDTLLSTPVFDSIKKSFPQAHVTLFVSKNNYPLFADHPSIDRFIVYHGGYKKFFSTVMQLRHTKPDVALLLHSNGPQDVPMAVFCGAKVILKTPTKSKYAYLLTQKSEDKAQHTIEDRLDLVRAMGGLHLTSRMSLPPRYEKPTHRKYLPQNAKVIGFQMGAANVYKMWPAENFAQLASKLLSHDENIIIAITGTKKEAHLAKVVVEACGGDRVKDFCGACTIDELPHLVGEFDLLVTNDTGTMHVAIALEVPTVALFGGSESLSTGALQDIASHLILQKDGAYVRSKAKKTRDDSAMRLICVDEVFEACLSD